MTNEEHQQHLDELRNMYINWNPAQRYRVIKQRINNPDRNPNKLVTLVSAVEALSRSILLDLAHVEGISKNEEYKKLRSMTPKSMLVKICANHRVNERPKEVFGKCHWDNFHWAVEYRNLLVHECTFLQQGVSDELVDSTDRILKVLAEFYQMK